MKAIVAVDEKWGIGKNNGLLFSIPEDMKFFRETTLNKVIVMGANTLKSFPNGKPLKNRTNIVLSSREGQREDCIVVDTLQKLSTELKKYNTDDVFIIGGAMFYKTMLPYCSEVFVTKVSADGNAEVFFENLDNLSNWKCFFKGEPIDTNGLTIRFTKYINSDIKEF